MTEIGMTIRGATIRTTIIETDTPTVPLGWPNCSGNGAKENATRREAKINTDSPIKKFLYLFEIKEASFIK